MRFTTLSGRLRRSRGVEDTTRVGGVSSSYPPEPETPSFVDQYLLERPIGAGGQGDVFAAWDTLLLRPVALKRLRNSLTSVAPPHVMEARHSAGLQHAAFVRIYGVVNDENGHWIVMERVFGRELSLVIQEGPLPVGTAVALMSQAASAMAEVHRAGLIHGDIKPSNLMIQSDGDLRVLDFGIARSIAPSTAMSSSEGVLAGTLAYMAPECLDGDDPSTASDIYALGAVVLEVLGGRRHSMSRTASVIAWTDSSEPWWIPPTVPDPLARLIRSMGARDPARRPVNMAAVVDALDGLDIPRAPFPNSRHRHHVFGRFRASGLRGWLLLVIMAGMVVTDRPTPPETPGRRLMSLDQQDLQAGRAALLRFDEDGAIARAIGHFEVVVNRSQRNAAALAWLALALCISYGNDGHNEALLKRAQSAARQAVEIDDQLAIAHAAEGWVLELLGDRQSAWARYEQSLRLDPDNPYAGDGRVRILMAQGQLEQALTLATALRSKHPEDRMYADLLGMVHFARGDMTAAERAFRDSIRIQPDAVFAYANLNAVLLRQGRPDEALTILQQGLQIRPAGRLYTNLGNALYARGDFSGAAAAFKAAVEGPHGNPNFYLRWANLADALRWVPGEITASAAAYQRALDLLEPVLERDPSAANVSRAALYQARLGQSDAARKRLAALENHPPPAPDPNYRMALAYEVIGQRSQALKSLQRSLEQGYPPTLVEVEPEFVALRADAGFKSLINRGKEH